MGQQSRWGNEQTKIHTDYEKAVEQTVDWKARASSLLDSYIEEVAVDSDTPEEIARAVAAFTEAGSNGRNPGWMHQRYEELTSEGKHLKPDQWDQGFKDQTGESVNFSVNAIAKLLIMLSL